MKVTSVKIHLTENAGTGIKAFSDIVIEDAFCVHGIKVIEKEDKTLFIGMPTKKVKDAWKEVVHPINQECRGMIVEAVSQEYYKVLAEASESEKGVEETPET